MGEFHGFQIIQSDKIDEYRVPGVWAMLGVKKTDNPKGRYTCLNVGKSICISDELKIDMERLRNFELVRKRKYKNQFNEVMFSYDEYATRQDFLYKNIAEEYDDIIFILVASQSQNTYTIEKYFAYSTKSRYWVSNGRYSHDQPIDDSVIDKIRRDIDVSKIDAYLIDSIDEFKTWYDNQ